MENYTPYPPAHEPFGEIALALSGGGFRAAAYALGCLSYLERVSLDGRQSLLSKATFISSASGGSITSMYYALQSAQKTPFKDILDDLFQFLENGTAITSAFARLQADEAWTTRPEKGRNLINSFALAYDDQLFKGKTFGDLMDLQNSHINELCINATEFHHGISFRFQIGSGKNGNSEITLARNTALKLKLADILAASSCFPLGFEPMILPTDFSYDQLSANEILENTTGGVTVGLMDGGITDNQGIYSFLLAEDRKSKNGKGYDNFIYCDVASPYMDSYKLPKENKKNILGKVSVQSYLNIFKLSPVFFMVSLWGLVHTDAWWMISLTTILFMQSVLYLASVIWYWRTWQKAKKTKSTWLITIFEHINKILFTRTSAIVQMLQSRIKSGGILVGDVYLKQIRRLTIKSLYTNSKSGEKWKTHALSSCIYELCSINTERSNSFFEGLKTLKGESIIGDPSETMISIADSAREVETTLWFDENHMKRGSREHLVAAGQFTTCYNLLKYICKLEKSSSATPELLAFRDELYEDWKLFLSAPTRIALPASFSTWTRSKRG
jgi:predicted acylesterase/phospholipase RssA